MSKEIDFIDKYMTEDQKAGMAEQVFRQVVEREARLFFLQQVKAEKEGFVRLLVQQSFTQELSYNLEEAVKTAIKEFPKKNLLAEYLPKAILEAVTEIPDFPDMVKQEILKDIATQDKIAKMVADEVAMTLLQRMTTEISDY